jgi:GT2 family glycosyltransferase
VTSMEKSQPFISVIIPTYDRPAELSRCLCALAAQNYPRDCFEVLVVDDGSVTELNDTGPVHDNLDVTFLRQPHSGPAMARNCGSAHARGSYLAFTDDDCAPAPDWLRSFSASIMRFPDSVLGGRTTNELVSNPYSTASQLLVDYLYARWNPAGESAAFFASNNLALPAKCLSAVGGFDPRWHRAAGEDRDLCDRLVGHGYRLIFVRDALVHHAHALTFRTFWRQHFHYGLGAYHLHRVRADRAAGRLRFEPAAFYLKLIAYPFTQCRPGKAAVLATLLAIAQAANAVGWMAAALRCYGRWLANRLEAEHD